MPPELAAEVLDDAVAVSEQHDVGREVEDGRLVDEDDGGRVGDVA